jgi:hypothetical protein
MAGSSVSDNHSAGDFCWGFCRGVFDAGIEVGRRVDRDSGSVANENCWPSKGVG